MRVGPGGNRSPVWRCCGSPKETTTPQAPRSAGQWGETTDRLKRARLLPAYVEIMLAVGDTQEARSACRALTEIAEEGYESGVLGAIVAYATGAVDLADGDASAALIAMRHAWQEWQDLQAPYEAARTRVSWRSPAARWATTTRPHWSWTQPEMPSRG